MKVVLFSSIFYVSLLTAHSQSWFRYPSISPDGTEIVFSSNGDLFKVSSAGGRAVQLTSNPAHDYRPVWSNDGEQIAFASNRYGNFDVFIISKNGGEPKRLTYFSRDDTPFDFTPDNQNVVFYSQRLDEAGSLLHMDRGELYTVSIEGGRPNQMKSFDAFAPNFNSDGDFLFEEIKGYEDPLRKHHTSSIARDIWICKNDTTYQQLTTNPGEDRNAVFGQGSTFYFLSERDEQTFNVYKSSLDTPAQSTQISSFQTHPVRHLSVSDDGLLCYSFNGTIYIQREGSEPSKVEIDFFADLPILESQLLFIGDKITQMDLSPSGKEMAFIYRGEVFVSSLDGSIIKRITKTPEQERTVDFSPDGRSLVYAGERNGSWNLYLSSLSKSDEKFFVNSTGITEKPLLESDVETFQPSFSPDGKKVAYLEDRIKLRVITISSGIITNITDGSSNFSYADGDQYYQWSPDGKWFLLEFNPDAYWFSEAGLISSDGKGSIINLTKSGFSDYAPKWSEDRNMIYWATNKNAMKSVSNTGPTDADIFGMFLSQKAFDKFSLSKTEYELMYDEEVDVEEEEDEKEEVMAPLEIQFSGLDDRKEKLTIHSSNISDAVITPDGKHLLYFTKIDAGYDLWQTDLRTRETKVLSKIESEDPGAIHIDKDGKSAYILSGGAISKVELESGEIDAINLNGEMPYNATEERLYIFDHVVRQVQDKFYDPGLHGLNWEMLAQNYQQFVPGLNNDLDFKEVLSELLGELNASHTGSRYYHQDKKGDKTASLGVFYDQDFQGDGLKILEVIDGSPLIRGSGKVTAGTIIEKIDGQSIVAGANFYPLLNRKAGKATVLSYLNPGSGERWTETVKPITLNEEFNLLYKRWVKRNRKIVHELSDERIGYMHVESMNDRSFREFLDDVMGDEVNKEALIVDTRSNGGGDLVDDLTTFLSGEKYMEFKQGNRIIGTESQRRWTKPSLLLVGEDNYSDAHCIAAGYADLEIGKIVGMPVPGTCTFVWWERMQNGMVFGIPNMGVWDKSGEVLENKMFTPEFVVKNPFGEIVDGKDRQLEKAVMELMKELE
ncbi:MAG: S41 family peptidase [Cyclobacteriaceae bacterium]